jgi:zinc transport system ATP-binding protein
MPMSSDPVLEIRLGTVMLGGTTVLDGVDFFVGGDEFVALLGENGSGKTTLVRSLLGLVPLRAGTVKLFGEPIGSFRDWARIGYVPQRFTAAAGVPATVEEVVTSGRVARARLLRRAGATGRVEVEKALEAVGLTAVARKRVSSLSGGQQQRVLIARALATDPDVLVLDEPVSSVDIENQEAFAATLRRLRSESKSVLLVAHALGAMESLVDRAVVMAGGGVVYEGPPRPIDAGAIHVHHEPAAELGTGAYRKVAGDGP